MERAGAKVPPKMKMLIVLTALALSLGACLPGSSGDSTEAERTTERATNGAPGEQTTVPEETGQAPAQQEAPPQQAPEQSREVTQESQPEPQEALVPITHLTSPERNVTTEELSQRETLAVPQGLAGTASEMLGAEETGFQELGSASEVVEHVSRTPGAMGLVPWQELTPEVRALEVEGESLLEPGASEPGDYPLLATSSSPETGAGTAPEAVPDPDQLRRVVFGGDVVMDRGMVYAVFEEGRGLEFPLSGGQAAITERTPQQSEYSEFGVIHQFQAERRGGAGEVREYLSGSDLALANLENPVIEDAEWNPSGTVFHGDLRLLPVLEGFGIDGVTLANNHILDADVEGLQETLGHLDEAGIEHAGAGMDLSSAREPMVFDLGGLTVGVLSHQNVPYYEWSWAEDGIPGTAPLVEDVLREDVRALEGEVDLTVVMPHWGEEYTATPEPEQVELAHAAVEEGADLVVGSHAHWPKGMELHAEQPIFYGTGNFLFDQSWSLETSTGIFAEVTLYEERVIQAQPVPFVILDQAQPNFLLPEEGGREALELVYGTSLGAEFEAYEADLPGQAE